MTISPDTQITELTVNDHACLTFGEPAELLDLTAAFIRDGLLAGLKVVWVTDLALARVAPELASRGIAVEPALSGGQLSPVGWEDGLLGEQGFDPTPGNRDTERPVQGDHPIPAPAHNRPDLTTGRECAPRGGRPNCQVKRVFGAPNVRTRPLGRPAPNAASRPAGRPGLCLPGLPGCFASGID